MGADELYNALLHLYPAAFREEYAREMRLSFRRRRREESGIFGTTLLWLSVIADTVFTAAQEHFDMLMHDIRYSLRNLRRTPAFTLAALITLALGVGATTAIYGLVHTVLLRPFPYAQPDRVVYVWERNPTLNIPLFSASLLNFLSWQEQSRSFETLAAFSSGSANLTDNQDPQRVLMHSVTADFWNMVRIQMVRGRGFAADEAVSGNDRVAVLSEGLWRQRYGADPGIVGRSILVNGESRVIVGIAPQDIGHTSRVDLWIPLVPNPSRENRGNHVVAVIGRLKPGVTVAQADDEINAVAERLERDYPKSNTGWRTRIMPVKEWIVDEDARSSLYALMAGVALLLIGACSNIAGLLVTRATARAHEFGVRLALGASRARLIRQLTTESLVLASIGGGLGLVCAVAAIRWLSDRISTLLPRSTNMTVDWPMFAFALMLTVFVGVLFGLAPAWSVRRADIQTTLRKTGRGVTGGGALLRLGLVGGQVAVATILIIASLLLVQSLSRLQRVDLGFVPDHILTASINITEAKYPTDEKAGAFFRALIAEVQALPGVVSAGLTSAVPLGGGNTSMPIGPVEPSADVPAQGIQAYWRLASSEYLRTLQVPLRRGRLFDSSDSQRPAVILSEILARRLWPDGSDPIERQVKLGNGQVLNVVGVVGDMRLVDLRNDFFGTMYFSPQDGNLGLTLAIRTTTDPAEFASSLREAVKRADPTQPVFAVRTMGELIEANTAQPRIQTTLLTAFAVLALVLGVVGIAGVVAYAVEQRTAELAVRMALGASPSQAMRSAAQSGVIASCVGLLAGLAGAWALSKWMETLLFQVRPDDPSTFAAVGVALLAVSVVACWLPARRATRIDPVIALRQE